MEEQRSIAGPVIVMVLITGGVIYTFGYLRAVMHRANSDYKKTKAGLPGMRKAFWSAWWSALKVGFWIFIGIFILTAWFFHDTRTDKEQPVPAATVKPSVSRSHR